MAHLAGRLPRRRTSVHRVANRQLLRYDGYRIALHAGPHGYHRRPLDPRAEAAGHLPAHQRRVPRRSRLANRLRTPVHLHVDERHVLHAHHRPLELGGLQCPRPGETRCREALPAHPGLGHGRLHRRHVVRRSGSDRRRTDQTDLLATVRFGHPLPDSCDLLLHVAGLSGQSCPEKPVVDRHARTPRIRSLQGETHGDLLHLLDAAGRRSSDYQCLRRQLHSELRARCPNTPTRPSCATR